MPRSMPNDGRHPGSLTVSIYLAGSQKPTVRPMRMNIGGGAGHTHIGELMVSTVVTSSVEPAISIPAIEIGNMELQLTRSSSLKSLRQAALAGVERESARKKLIVAIFTILFLRNMNLSYLHKLIILFHDNRGSGRNPEPCRNRLCQVKDIPLESAHEVFPCPVSYE